MDIMKQFILYIFGLVFIRNDQFVYTQLINVIDITSRKNHYFIFHFWLQPKSAEPSLFTQNHGSKENVWKKTATIQWVERSLT